MEAITTFKSEILPDNHYLELTAQGIYAVVSLNVEARMLPFLSKNNLIRSKKRNVYRLREIVEVPTTVNVNNTFAKLLKRNMITCREAKQLAIEKEIEIIKYFK